MLAVFYNHVTCFLPAYYVAFLMMQHNSQVESNKTAATNSVCPCCLTFVCMYVPDGCFAYGDAVGLMVQYRRLLPSFPQEHNDLS